MEISWFSTPEEGVTKLQQDENHVNCVFHWEGVLYHEYAPPGQTTNKKYYVSVLSLLTEAI